MLIDSGFPDDIETNDGHTAFQLAAYHGHTNILSTLLNRFDIHDQIK